MQQDGLMHADSRRQLIVRQVSSASYSRRLESRLTAQLDGEGVLLLQQALLLGEHPLQLRRQLCHAAHGLYTTTSQ